MTRVATGGLSTFCLLVLLVPLVFRFFMGFKTDAIHAGQEPDPSTGAVTVPIYQTSTYVQEGLGKHKGFEYARTQNPTRMALEKNMAVLERGVAGYAFASGMAATTALTHLLLKQGDHAICSDNVYGGTSAFSTRSSGTTVWSSPM